MNRIEYIRYSHRRANSRVRAWIGSVRMRLVRRSRLLGWIWMVPASIFYALVVLFSWLTFCVVLFRDPRFTLHYLESEIECRGLSGAEARRYLDEQHRDYERRLAYGNFTRDEQRRIDQTFAYLYNRYPAPVRDDLNARLDEVQSAVAEIAGFTRQRQEELEQARERETALQAQAEKRRAINRSRTGFDPTPEDFSPRLTDRQQARAKSLCRVPSSCLQGASTREKDGKDCPNKRKHWQTMSSAFFLRFFVSVITSPCVVQRLCQTF